MVETIPDPVTVVAEDVADTTTVADPTTTTTAVIATVEEVVVVVVPPVIPTTVVRVAAAVEAITNLVRTLVGATSNLEVEAAEIATIATQAMVGKAVVDMIAEDLPMAGKTNVASMVT